MEVHPPHSPVRSIKDFMVHLLAITIGLLIALGLEASVEWMHHRRLVHEARQNIAQEIRDNQQNLAKEMSSLPREEDQLEKLLKVISAEERGRRKTRGTFGLERDPFKRRLVEHRFFDRRRRAHGVRRGTAILSDLRLAADVQWQHGPLLGVAARHVRISHANGSALQAVSSRVRRREARHRVGDGDRGVPAGNRGSTQQGL